MDEGVRRSTISNMQSWISQHDSALFLFFPAVLPLAILPLVTAVLSHIGGWAALAERFRTDTPFAGEQWRWQSGRMRSFTNYNGCLTVGANESGLYLATMVLFRFKHPPLLIPWEEITAQRKRIWLIEGCQLTLGRRIAIPLWIRRSLADKLMAAAAGHWPEIANFETM